MRRLVAVLALLLPAVPAAAQELVEVSTLYAEADAYDQQVVTIRGEIVGDYGDRGTTVWVQVNDDPYVDQPLGATGRLAGTNTGISVKLSAGVPATFGAPGGYGTRGPVVEVTGIFRDLDPALGGLTFIEATEVELVVAAETVFEPGPDVPQAVLGAALTALGVLAMAQRRDLLRRSTRT